jgi:hypothetical protein
VPFEIPEGTVIDLFFVFKHPILALRICLSSFLHPLESWNHAPGMMQFLTACWTIQALVAVFMIRFRGVLQEHQGNLRRHAQRDLLRQLVKSKTPDELWDEVQIFCVREGVRPGRTSWVATRWANFKNTYTRGQLSENIRRIFELGRGSVLRDLAGLDSMDKVRRLCEDNRQELAKWECKLYGDCADIDFGLEKTVEPQRTWEELVKME